MSATPSANVERTIEQCQPDDLQPVSLDAQALDSTAPEYLRDLKHELTESGYVPSVVTVRACFDEDCSLETQRHRRVRRRGRREQGRTRALGVCRACPPRGRRVRTRRAYQPRRLILSR